MREKFYGMALLLALSFFLGMIVSLRAGLAPAVQTEPAAQTDAAQPGQQSPGVLLDAETEFAALGSDGCAVQRMDEYLVGVLAGEMPASFDIEALKAQAVAARTYIIYKTEHETPAHPQAAVCDDPACCKAHLTQAEMLENWGDRFEEYREKLQRAVEATDGQYLVYEGEPIQAVFHSSSSGMTASSSELWGAQPYLTCVSSPETEESVPNFVSTVEVSPQSFAETLLSQFPQASTDTPPESWLGETQLSPSGRVSSVQLCGQTVTGTQLRTMFGLRSACFELEYTGESFLFTVRGFGHGVGMSQYGANTLALQGVGYAEILAHYYPGTQLVSGAL